MASRIFISLLMTFIGWLPLSLHAQKSSAWYAKGIKAEAKGLTDSAIYFYSKAISADATYLPAYTRRAPLYFNKKLYREALIDSRLLLYNNAANARDYARIAQIAEMSGMIDSATTYYKSAIAKAPAGQAGYYYYLQGRMMINAGKLKDGIKLLEQAEGNGYKEMTLYWQLGSAYIKNLEMKPAANALTKAIDLSPTNDTLYAERAYALMQAREYAMAIEDYRHFLKKYPKDIISLYGIGEAFYASEQYDSAVATFIKLSTITQGPYYQQWYYMGMSAAGKGDYALAVDAFTAAIDQYPQRGDIYYNRGIAKGKLNPNIDFCSDFKKAMDLGNADGKKMWESFCKK